MIETNKSVIAKRSFDFALEVIVLTKALDKSLENITLIKQIIRSATSIGANIEEALGANSKRDFIHCMNIAKKEARETHYWLRILFETNPKVKVKLELLLKENFEIISMLTKIVKTASSKL